MANYRKELQMFSVVGPVAYEAHSACQLAWLPMFAFGRVFVIKPQIINLSFAKMSAGRIMRRFVHSGCEVHRPAASGRFFPALPPPSELGSPSRATDAFWNSRNRRSTT